MEIVIQETQITEITGDLDQRVTDLENGAVDVDIIPNDLIATLFDDPVIPVSI